MIITGIQLQTQAHSSLSLFNSHNIREVHKINWSWFQVLLRVWFPTGQLRSRSSLCLHYLFWTLSHLWCLVRLLEEFYLESSLFLLVYPALLRLLQLVFSGNSCYHQIWYFVEVSHSFLVLLLLWFAVSCHLYWLYYKYCRPAYCSQPYQRVVFWSTMTTVE